MSMQILTHTPSWVFILFALLVWLGARQLTAGSMNLTRITLLPVAMVGLSIFGVLSTFPSPVALLCWTLAGALIIFIVLQRKLPEGTHYHVETRRFHVRGSAVPLLLMMGIFFTKYAVGVALALHPELRQHTVFVLFVPALFGAFSGIFAGRAMRLWKLAIREDRTVVEANANISAT